MIDKKVFQNYPIPEEDPLWEKLERLNFTPKTVLPANILVFLEKGTVRKYYLDRDREFPEQISMDFYLTGSLFITNTDMKIGDTSYETIDRGTLWYIDMSLVNEMFVGFQQCRTAQKLFMEETIQKQTLREIQLLKSTPEAIYLSLLDRKPEFIKNVPLKYLASYIGITPQALSRIRKRIS